MGIKIDTSGLRGAGNFFKRTFTTVEYSRKSGDTYRRLRFWPTAIAATTIGSLGGIGVATHESIENDQALQNMVNRTKVELVTLPETNGQPTIRAVFAGAQYTLLGTNTIQRVEANIRYEFNLDTDRVVEVYLGEGSGRVYVEDLGGRYASAASSAQKEMCVMSRSPVATQSQVAMNFQRKYC